MVSYVLNSEKWLRWNIHLMKLKIPSNKEWYRYTLRLALMCSSRKLYVQQSLLLMFRLGNILSSHTQKRSAQGHVINRWWLRCELQCSWWILVLRFWTSVVCENFCCWGGAPFSGLLDWSEWEWWTYSTGNSGTEWLIELVTVGKSDLLVV